MRIEKFQPKQVAPIQYLLKRLNTDAGLVVPGWGTTWLMVSLIGLFIVFLLLILQVYNASILLAGIQISWLGSPAQPAGIESPPVNANSFATTGLGVTLGLLVFAAGCAAFILYGARTYPTNKA